MRVRPILLAILLAAANLTVLWIQRGYTLGAIEPPAKDWSRMPLDFGAFKGKDVEADPQLLERLQARVAVNREYRDAMGNLVLVHAVWTDDYIRIHFPEQCYTGAGWRLTATRQLLIPIHPTLRIPAQLLTFERDQDTLYVLYWFQLGDRFFFDRWTHRSARQDLCWGHTEWPPLMKVMMETPAANAEQAEPRLRKMAVQVYSWIHDVAPKPVAAASR